MKLFFILMSIITFANANVTSGGYGACISESYYKEWNAADTTGMQYLMNSKKCLILKSGMKYSMVDRGFLSSVIRVYVGNDSFKLWTANENIK